MLQRLDTGCSGLVFVFGNSKSKKVGRHTPHMLTIKKLQIEHLLVVPYGNPPSAGFQNSQLAFITPNIKNVMIAIQEIKYS